MRWPAIRPFLVGVPLVFGGIFVGMLGLAFAEPPGRPLAVVAPGGVMGAVAAVAGADGAILQVRGDTVIAIDDAPGFVARLYRAGALIVVPARTAGCIVAPRWDGQAFPLTPLT